MSRDTANSLARPAIALVAGLVATRVAYHAAGVRFDLSPLYLDPHLVDPPLLRHHLVSSIWHLHYQPPLFNLYVGLVLKSGAPAHAVFHLAHVLASLVLALTLLALMVRLGVGPWWSAVLAFAFVGSPVAVLYENWFYVEYPVAVALAVAALLLVVFAQRREARYAAAAFAVLAAIVLTRSLFHLVWLLAVVALVAALSPGVRRRVLWASAIPVALCVGLYAKNLVEWDVPASSTCAGINLYRVATDQLSPATRRRLVAERKLSLYALVNPGFLAPRVRYLPRVKRTGVPLLDRPLKSWGGANLNAKLFTGPCDNYLDDALTVIRTHPGAFARGVENGALIYFRPASDYKFLPAANRRHLHGFERIFSIVAFGQFERTEVSGIGPASQNLAAVGWFIVLAYAGAVAVAVATLRRTRRSGGVSSPDAIVAGLFLLTFAWVTLAGNLLDAGENNRFRIVLDPLVLVVLASWGSRRLSRRARFRAARPPA